ncbi:hypothetical protein [Bacillus sp. MUM 13]|uniref:hypothetical protein n=1 Tax=Bacillus sp. MUM 13 TaxID=1678001 RepID=UPI0008F579E0|nr:hypothetical protein [Bacillus sp. MUM 13]OIK07444.1 hypothetical protein BIV59_20975 [Bacillus sp. MUM 13]
MFDPTAYENMKVVIEGAFYDRDLEGEIAVTGRQDIMNLADLSRKFSIEMELKEHMQIRTLKGGMTIEASLENLGSELLQPILNESQAGCSVRIFISFPYQLKQQEIGGLMALLSDIWGEERLIEITSSKVTESRSEAHEFLTNASISFGRLVAEDQLDDLLDMIDYLIRSLEKIHSFLAVSL